MSRHRTGRRAARRAGSHHPNRNHPTRFLNLVSAERGSGHANELFLSFDGPIAVGDAATTPSSDVQLVAGGHSTLNLVNSLKTADVTMKVTFSGNLDDDTEYTLTVKPVTPVVVPLGRRWGVRAIEVVTPA